MNVPWDLIDSDGSEKLYLALVRLVEGNYDEVPCWHPVVLRVLSLSKWIAIYHISFICTKLHIQQLGGCFCRIFQISDGPVGSLLPFLTFPEKANTVSMVIKLSENIKIRCRKIACTRTNVGRFLTIRNWTSYNWSSTYTATCIIKITFHDSPSKPHLLFSRHVQTRSMNCLVRFLHVSSFLFHIHSSNLDYLPWIESNSIFRIDHWQDAIDFHSLMTNTVFLLQKSAMIYTWYFQKRGFHS